MSSSNKLNPYKSRLTSEQAAAGMNAAIQNAHRLAGDARLLLDAGKIPSALSLAILSLEEAGKVSILRGMIGECSEENLRDAWRRYRSHTAKNHLGLMLDFVKEGARHFYDFLPLFTDSSSEDRSMLDQLKQISFYTDCLGNAHWSKPMEVISQDLASVFVVMAEIMSKKSVVTTTEAELWEQHMTPLANDRALINEQFENWIRAMVDAGLMTEQHGRGLAKFTT